MTRTPVRQHHPASMALPTPDVTVPLRRVGDSALGASSCLFGLPVVYSPNIAIRPPIMGIQFQPKIQPPRILGPVSLSATRGPDHYSQPTMCRDDVAASSTLAVSGGTGSD